MDLYKLTGPILRFLPAELSHGLGIWALKQGFAPHVSLPKKHRIETEIWGKKFCNPIGLAAGFDKDSEAVAGFLGLGFGFVELGTVTPKPQPGNPRPRLFRLKKDHALINRMGFNNGGLEQFRINFERAKKNAPNSALLGANLGANRTSEDRIGDYEQGLTALKGLADYFVINISSPNTPGLRDLQKGEALRALLSRIFKLRQAENILTTPLLLKISPDLEAGELETIMDTAHSFSVDGLILSNTTLDRPLSLRSPQKTEAGGLSGAPLYASSTRLLAKAYLLGEGKMPLIGVGGVATPLQAFEKILAGASLVQIYSALIYQGPLLVRALVEGVDELLEQSGYAHLSDAVGREAERIASEGPRMN